MADPFVPPAESFPIKVRLAAGLMGFLRPRVVATDGLLRQEVDRLETALSIAVNHRNRLASDLTHAQRQLEAYVARGDRAYAVIKALFVHNWGEVVGPHEEIPDKAHLDIEVTEDGLATVDRTYAISDFFRDDTGRLRVTLTRR